MLRHTRRLVITGFLVTGIIVAAGIVAKAKTTPTTTTPKAESTLSVVRTSVDVTPSAHTLKWGGSVRLVARLSGPAGPVPGRPVSFWDRDSTHKPWRQVASLTTDTHGTATIVVQRLRSTTHWQARYAGDPRVKGDSSPATTVQVVRQARSRATTVRVRRPPPSTVAFGVRVVREAARHKGAPYQWGAEGPDRFDCSGFTLYVFAKFGISLPRTAEQQYEATRRIAPSKKQIGDLIFFGAPGSVHHVGIYAGHNRMWAAVQTGEPVQLESIAGRPYLVGRVH